MIFISMRSSDLLAQTSRYQMHESPPPSPTVEVELENFDFEQFMNEERAALNSNIRPPSRRRESTTTRSIPPPVSNTYPRRSAHGHTPDHPLFTIDGGENNTYPRDHESSPAFDVSTTCEEPTSDEEEPTSPVALADRNRRDRQVRSYEGSSDEDTEDGLDRVARETHNRQYGTNYSYRRRAARRSTPRTIEVVDKEDGKEEADKRNDLLEPHARFFIEKERSVVTVKFDPPVLVFSSPSFPATVVSQCVIGLRTK